MKVFNLVQARAALSSIISTVTDKDKPEPCYIISKLNNKVERRAVVISKEKYDMMINKINEGE